MKALIVQSSSIQALGYRLDVRPYLSIATETPAALREQTKVRARRAYWKAARAGIRHAQDVTEWQRSVMGPCAPRLLETE